MFKEKSLKLVPLASPTADSMQIRYITASVELPRLEGRAAVLAKRVELVSLLMEDKDLAMASYILQSHTLIITL